MKDIVVIGAGIVGLASAWQLISKKPSLKISILEKESTPAQHQTGHNSGVIHSGIYYKPKSLKAINCIKGYHLMLDFCRKNDVNFDLCGKVVVAVDKNETSYLQTLFERGKQNGLTNMKWLNQEGLKTHEPYVYGVKGLYVPQTGIIDYKQVCSKLELLLIDKGVTLHYNQQVRKITQQGTKSTVESSTMDTTGRCIVNCAGLYSDKVAKMTPLKPNFKIIPFRGEYYQLKDTSKRLVNHLIYPVPNPHFPFLGVHFTRMINGGVEVGPNAVLAFAREGYAKSDINLKELVETLAWSGFQKVAMKYWKTGLGEMYRSFSKVAFTKALQRLIPEIKASDLTIGGAGVRAQACDRNGGLLDDFHILEDNHFVHVCNAPSPAATSSLAIGDEIAQRVIQRL